jgi:hypothetical protein
MIEGKRTESPKPTAGTSEAMSSMESRFETLSFMLPQAIRAFAENQVVQRKDNFASLSTVVQEVYSTSVRGLDEYGQKVMEARHQDANATYDCCRELIAAKSFPEVMDFWTNHAPRQFNAMSRRTSELWALYWKVTADAVKPVAVGISHTLARSE